MRSSSPLFLVSPSRPAARRPASSKMHRPTPLPTIIPTQSSWLQRLLWLFTPGR